MFLFFFFIWSFMNKVIIWNYQKARGNDFISSTNLLLQDNKLDILVLLETRILATKSLKILSSVGFNKNEIMEGEGFSGGIWMAWKSSKVIVKTIEKKKKKKFYFIHSEIKYPKETTWLLTVVYANPNNDVKIIL